ncbi:MAG: hypothetical protein RRC07_03110 [Anaerolineae bacterium]|nr:hypothetical protein [Anaerolineae bacterium]
MEAEELAYVEETFGILTDDDIYLDCVLVKPAETADDDLKALRAWIPRYPLTKSSVITCARQEVSGAGPNGNVAHLVFDLRGTGHSEGERDEHNFDLDLEGIRLWAKERFGDVNFGFLGTPTGSEQVQQVPIRAGVVFETYHYRPVAGTTLRGAVVYLSTYGNFSRADDARAIAMAEAGYEVFGLEPLRYLLHASVQGRITPNDLWKDFQTFCNQLPTRPLLIGMPVSAGLALMWTAGVDTVRGVLAIGHAQAAFKPYHIFFTKSPHTFFLSRYVHKVAPRPIALVYVEDHILGGDRDELAALYQTSIEPRDLQTTGAITPAFLLERLEWLENPT